MYEMKNCIARPGVSKSCMFKAFNNSRSRACSVPLLKTVELATGKKILYPIKVYCYQSVKASLQNLLLQPNFYECCEQWRSPSNRIPGVLNDIYDGSLWSDFMQYNGEEFLAVPGSIALSLNVDWFQPYKLTQSSVGVIFFTILNLPRSIRYKQQYTILAGIMPGPDEPKRDINTFLDPIVKELLDLWTGVEMNIYSHSTPQTIRCALLCVTCDLPAGKKVAGFLGHMARLGCSKCLKEFGGSFGNMDYSGFNRSSWPPRTNDSHRSDINKIKQSRNKTQRNQKESEYGCRYSVLLKLPYFDPIRMVCLDPMHNLFLGTAKHMMKLWIEEGIITEKDLSSLQQTVDNIHVPSDVGRIPRKIETKFSGFTADQFKNWVTLFSIPTLFDQIDPIHLECWRHFVLACRLLCQKSISQLNLQLADALLMQFCSKVEQLFGAHAITPNMHMHGHLREVIQDFGPSHTFWLFSYERFNGILGNQPNNNKSIEPQLMMKFSQESAFTAFEPPTELAEEFKKFTTVDDSPAENSVESFVLPPRSTRGVLSHMEIVLLKDLLSNLHSINTSAVAINSCCRKYNSVKISSMELSSCLQSSSHHYIAMADWKIDVFGSPPSQLPAPHYPYEHIRPVKILHFASITYSINDADTTLSKFFAVVCWFAPHPSRYLLGQPAQVWCRALFEMNANSFVPIEYITSRCAYLFTRIEMLNEEVLVVVPTID